MIPPPSLDTFCTVGINTEILRHLFMRRGGAVMRKRIFFLFNFSNFTTSQAPFYITIDIKYPEMCFMKVGLDCTFARELHRSEFLWSDKWNCFLPFNERVSLFYNLDSIENYYYYYFDAQFGCIRSLKGGSQKLLSGFFPLGVPSPPPP